MTKAEGKYYLYIQKAIDIDPFYDLNKITKKDLVKQEQKKTLLKGIHICVHNPDLIKMGVIIYKKYVFSRVMYHQLIKYYVKSFTNKESDEDDDDEIEF